MMENQYLEDPILLLIDYIASELRQEIIVNEDSTEFWKKAQVYIFDNSIVSVREGIKELGKGLEDSPDMYSYFSSLVFRIMAQPYASAAIDMFVKGFDATVEDHFFRDGFGFNTEGMSKVEKLLVFITVHRNHIQLTFIQAEQEAEQARLAALQQKRHGGKQA